MFLNVRQKIASGEQESIVRMIVEERLELIGMREGFDRLIAIEEQAFLEMPDRCQDRLGFWGQFVQPRRHSWAVLPTINARGCPCEQRESEQ